MVIVSGVIGMKDGGVAHVSDSGHNATVVAVTFDSGLRKRLRSIALDVVAKEQ